MKRSELAHQIKEMIVDVLQEATIETSPEDLAKVKAIAKPEDVIKVTEQDDEFDMEDEKEPSAKDIKKGDSVSTIARKLQDNTKEMKSTVNKWKQAEGEEKERLLARLKELTQIKKELEGLV
jgi:hypothetical protein